MPATDAPSLITDANSLQIVRDEVTLLQIQVYLLAQIAGAPYSTMSASDLETAATQQYQLIRDANTLRQVIIYLLAQIVQTV